MGTRSWYRVGQPCTTVCPGSSDPQEKMFHIFASENEVYTIYELERYFMLNIIRLQSKMILGHMNSIGQIVRFNILGRVTTSWTYCISIYIYFPGKGSWPGKPKFGGRPSMEAIDTILYR